MDLDEQIQLERMQEGTILIQEGKFEEAFNLLEELISDGVVYANLALGQFYQYGVYVEKDEERAFLHYSIASAHGYTSAHFYEAICYEKGRGIEKNEGIAFMLYLRVAESDSGYQKDALYAVARCYKNGIGVEEDEREATKYLIQAAYKGCAEAQYELGKCFFYGDVTVMDEEKAKYWLEQAVENGYRKAEEFLKENF